MTVSTSLAPDSAVVLFKDQVIVSNSVVAIALFQAACTDRVCRLGIVVSKGSFDVVFKLEHDFSCDDTINRFIPILEITLFAEDALDKATERLVQIAGTNHSTCDMIQ